MQRRATATFLNRVVPGVCLSFAASCAIAQDNTVIEEIIVTAQKREQNLQDVPVSITVFTQEQIRKSAIVTLNDYADQTPGFNVEQGADELSYEVTIRGIGQLGGTQNNFGLYLDDFELTGASAGNVSADLSDVERIEVLRGPQGTAFGRNVSAGAVNLTSIKPSTEGWSGSAELEASSYGGQRARGSVNAPLGESLAVRVTGSYRGSDGWIRNLGPAGQRNDYERIGWRTALRFTPTERLTIDAAAAQQTLDQGGTNTVHDGELIGTFVFLQEVIDAGLGGLPPGSLPAMPPAPYPAQNRFTATNRRGFLDATTNLYTVRGQYDFDGVSLISVSGYVDNERSSAGDFDDSAFDLFFGSTPYSRDRFWSSELRLQSAPAEDRPWSWIAGVYYSESSGKSHSSVVTGVDTELVTFVGDGEGGGGPLVPNDFLLFQDTTTDGDKSAAIFAEVEYDLTTRLTATLGARYNDDESSQSIRDAINLSGEVPDDDETVESTKVTWRASLNFKATDDVNVYVTAARGYRGGGVQLQSEAAPNFGPEEANNYELGIKTLLFGDRVNFNAAAFYTDWRDIQILTFDFSTGFEVTDNVGRAEVKGLEFDLRARPLEGLELTAGLSLLDTEIKEYVNFDESSFAGFRLPNTPETQATVTADYEHPLVGDIRGFVRATYVYVSNRLESIDSAEFQQFLPAFDTVDLRLGLRGKSWTVEAFGENLLDEVYSAGVLLSGFSLSGAGVTSPPRLSGVRVLKEF